MRIIILVLLLATITIPVTASDLLYDAGAPGVWGVTLRPNSDMEAIVQPFHLQTTSWVDRIGIGIGSGTNPNHVGMKVTLTNMNLGASIPGTTIAGSWNLMPTAGGAFAYAYTDIEPILLDSGVLYGLIIEPGDAQMSGGVAYCWNGWIGRGTSDDWATNKPLYAPTAIRIYGTEVPEPTSLASFAAIFACTGIGFLKRRLIS
jgi:hypothetical protein